VWDNLDIVFGVSKDKVDHEKLVIELYAENRLTHSELVGYGECSLLHTHISNRNKYDVHLSSDLRRIDGTYVGRVVVSARLEDDVQELNNNPVILESFVSGDLFVKRLRLDGLKNADWTGKKTPYFKVKFERKEQTTSIIPNIFSSCCWDGLGYKYDNISRERLQNGVIKLELWQKNTLLSDKLIGKGSIRTCYAGVHVNNVLELRADLIDEDIGKHVGRVTVDILLKDGTNTQPAINFNVGRLLISKIYAFAMPKSELYCSQVFV
jgi:hypothetical protein